VVLDSDESRLVAAEPDSEPAAAGPWSPGLSPGPAGGSPPRRRRRGRRSRATCRLVELGRSAAVMATGRRVQVAGDRPAAGPGPLATPNHARRADSRAESAGSQVRPWPTVAVWQRLSGRRAPHPHEHRPKSANLKRPSTTEQGGGAWPRQGRRADGALMLTGRRTTRRC
jgi:hypothetical protein